MPGFGKGTDFFDLPTEISNTNLKFIDSSTTPMATSVEEARDEDGNIAGQGFYEAGPADAIECVYHLLSGTLNTSDLYLGPVTGSSPSVAITSIEISTSNSEWPSVTVSGFTGATDTTNMPQFYLPSITINGKRQAQGIDFTVGAACRLTSSSLTASGEFFHALNEDGEVGAMAFSGANAEISGEAVEITGAVTWTPGVTWEETQAPGASNSNVSWGTGSFTAVKYLEEYTGS